MSFFRKYSKTKTNICSSSSFKKFPTRSVLVVEDDLDLKPPITKAIMEVDPFMDVVWVTTGHRAMEEISEHAASTTGQSFSLVISDIFLPGRTTGISLWKMVGKFEAPLPMILITASDEREVRKILGKIDHIPLILQKPLDLEYFKQTISFMCQTKKKMEKNNKGGSDELK